MRLSGLGLLAASIAVAGGVGLRAIGAGSGETSSGEQKLVSLIRTRQVGGQLRLVFPESARSAAGIVVEPLKAIEFQRREAALATALSPQALLDQRRAYQAAAAEAARGELAVRAARLEVQRLQRLHRDDRIVSDKALETAQVQAATEDTASRLAAGQLGLLAAAQRQQWGPTIAGWLVDGGPALERLMTGRDVLLEIAAPAGRGAGGSRAARLELPSGEGTEAAIIAAAAQADPKFQSLGFYAVAPASQDLLPGMTVSASILVGDPVQGTEVPDAAIVRWQGRSFAYVEEAEGEFARRPASSETATQGGWFVGSEMPAGTRVAVQGAQLLLSAELQRALDSGEGR